MSLIRALIAKNWWPTTEAMSSERTAPLTWAGVAALPPAPLDMCGEERFSPTPPLMRSTLDAERGTPWERPPADPGAVLARMLKAPTGDPFFLLTDAFEALLAAVFRLSEGRECPERGERKRLRGAGDGELASANSAAAAGEKGVLRRAGDLTAGGDIGVARLFR